MTLIAAVGAVLGVFLTAITVAVAVGRPMRRILKQNEDFRIDWHGTAARPGVDARPGVMERLHKIEDRAAAIETQLKPNGGLTLRDAVGRIEKQTDPSRSNGPGASDVSA